jgi:hypothetical protein
MTFACVVAAEEPAKGDDAMRAEEGEVESVS